MPQWGGRIDIDFQDIYYYLKPIDSQGRTWDDVPADIKSTFDKLGIPEAEKKYPGRREGPVRERGGLRLAQGGLVASRA